MSLTINGTTNTLTAASGLTIAGNTAVTGTLSSTGKATLGAAAGGEQIATTSVTTFSGGSGYQSFYSEGAERFRVGWKNAGADTGVTGAQVLLTGASDLTLASRDIAAGSVIVKAGSGIPTIGTFSSTGLAVTGLLDLSAASSGQIKFPATQNASADANTLDDYEEGTFTITASTGLTTTPSATAGYTKIGNAVTLSIPTLSGISNAATFVLTGIPAAIRADAPAGQLFPVRVSDNGAASVWGLGYVSNNGSLYLYKNMDGGNDWTASGTKSVSFCTVHYMTKVV